MAWDVPLEPVREDIVDNDVVSLQVSTLSLLMQLIP